MASKWDKDRTEAEIVKDRECQEYCTGLRMSWLRKGKSELRKQIAETVEYLNYLRGKYDALCRKV